MATFNKKEKEKKKLKKRKEKAEKKAARKEDNLKGGSLDDMMMYVDHNGQLTDTPPDPTEKKIEIDAESIELGIPKKEHVEAEPLTGRVEFFNDSKGYGFIKDANSSEQYFVHINGCLEDIGEGDKVTFELEKGMKGMNAVGVKKI